LKNCCIDGRGRHTNVCSVAISVSLALVKAIFMLADKIVYTAYERGRETKREKEKDRDREREAERKRKGTLMNERK
jgi:hypothetical protein